MLEEKREFDLFSMLSTEIITQNIPMPTCKYEVLEADSSGDVVRYATVGDIVYHKWSCDASDGSGSGKNLANYSGWYKNNSF